MKITEVEAIILRQPDVDDAIADGSQDDLIVLIHTDSGITGVGEVELLARDRQGRDRGAQLACQLDRPAPVLLGQDPLDIDGLWSACTAPASISAAAASRSMR